MSFLNTIYPHPCQLPPHPTTTLATCPHTLPHVPIPYHMPHPHHMSPIHAIAWPPTTYPDPCHMPPHPAPTSATPPHPATCPHTLPHHPTLATCLRLCYRPDPLPLPPTLPHAPTPCHMPSHPASYWRARSTDSEHINFLAVGALGAEILSPEFPNFGRISRVRELVYISCMREIYLVYICDFGVRMRTRMRKQKKMAAPIDSKWRPPWSRSNFGNFLSAAAILEFRLIRKFGAPYLSP